MKITQISACIKYYFLLYYYWHFDRKKIEDALKRRRGNCKNCGKCCIHLIRCPLLTNDNQCKIHDKWYRPILCKITPLDITPFGPARSKTRDCGFYWVKKNESNASNASV
jgi:Fe-S-cluster containining protein